MRKLFLLLAFVVAFAFTNSSCTKSDEQVYIVKLNGSYTDVNTGKTEEVNLKFKNVVLTDYNEETQCYSFKNGGKRTNTIDDSPSSPDLWLKKTDNTIEGRMILTRFTDQFNDHGKISEIFLNGDILNDEDDLSVSGTFLFGLDDNPWYALGDTTIFSVYLNWPEGTFTLNPR